VGAIPAEQGTVPAATTKALSPLQGAASYRHTVKQLLKSVVRQIRMLRSVGAGGGQLLRSPGGRSVMVVPTATAIHDEISPHKWGFWKLPKILGRSLSPGFSGQAIEFLHILRIGIGPALLSERGKKLFG
jgi:hypothetical protein